MKNTSQSLMRLNKALSGSVAPVNQLSFMRHYSSLRVPSQISSKFSNTTTAAAAGIIGASMGSYALYQKTSFTAQQSRWIHAESNQAEQTTEEASTKKAGYAPQPTDIQNYLPTHPDCEKLQKVLANAKSVKDLDVTLFQYQVCPFCCKARAFLDKNKIPYKVVEVHPVSKTELKWSEYKKVPVMVVNGMQLNDSSVIITSLSRFLATLNGQAGKPVDENEVKWRQWVDDRFVRVIPPNIYRTYDEAKSSFEYITDRGEFSFFQQKFGLYAGALAMWGVSKKLSKKYNITDERATLYDCAREWCEGIPKGQPFMGGQQPNLADLAVYGILSSIEGLRAFNDMCENTDIGTFYYRVKENIGQPSYEKKSLKEVQGVIDAVKAQKAQETA